MLPGEQTAIAHDDPDEDGGAAGARAARPRQVSRHRLEHAGARRVGHRYDAALAKDGDTQTAWSEGVAGARVGESLEFSFDSPVSLSSVELVTAYAKCRRLYRRHGRVSQVRVVTDRGSRLSALRDERADFLAAELRTGRTDFVRLVIDGVFGGERYEGTLISEVRFRLEPRR